MIYQITQILSQIREIIYKKDLSSMFGFTYRERQKVLKKCFWLESKKLYLNPNSISLRLIIYFLPYNLSNCCKVRKNNNGHNYKWQ